MVLQPPGHPPDHTCARAGLADPEMGPGRAWAVPTPAPASLVTQAPPAAPGREIAGSGEGRKALPWLPGPEDACAFPAVPCPPCPGADASSGLSSEPRNPGHLLPCQRRTCLCRGAAAGRAGAGLGEGHRPEPPSVGRGWELGFLEWGRWEQEPWARRRAAVALSRACRRGSRGTQCRH